MVVTDREFLIWLHERLEHVHGENDLVDYMHFLRKIIRGTPADKRTIQPFSNSLEDLKKQLANIDHKGGKTAGHCE